MNKFKLRGEEVADGAFPNERVVRVKDYEGNDCGVVVQAGQVEQIGNQYSIEVKPLGHKDGVTLVRLPGELLTSGWTLSVKDSQLEQV